MIPGLNLGFGSLFPVGMAGKLKEMVAQGKAVMTASKHPSGRMKMSRKNDHGRTAREVFAPLTDKHTGCTNGPLSSGKFRETFPALQNFPIKRSLSTLTEVKSYTAEEAAAMAEVANRIASSFFGRLGHPSIYAGPGHILGGLGPSRVPAVGAHLSEIGAWNETVESSLQIPAVDTKRGYLLHGPLAQIGPPFRHPFQPRTGRLSSSTPNLIERKRTPAGRVHPTGNSPASIDFGLSGPGDEYGLAGAPVTGSPVQRWEKREKQGEPVFPPGTSTQRDGWKTFTPPSERCSSENSLEASTHPSDAVGPIDRGESCSRLGEVEIAEPEDRLLDSHTGGALFDNPSTADHDSTDSHDW